MQNPNFVLPLAFSKIVYKPPGSKKRSSHPDETHMCGPRARPGDAAALGPAGSSSSGSLLPALPLFIQPSILVLDKYSYYTHFTSVKHHQPLSFGH